MTASLSKEEREQLLRTLKSRFEQNVKRHQGFDWHDLHTRLQAKHEALWSLNEMERTGGEPDVIGRDQATGEYHFCDCSAETPSGRRNTCYNREGRMKREKEGLRPAGSVLEMAAAIGIEPLAEDQYRALQSLGSFDTKTQSWLRTPADIEEQDGAVFGDRRFGHVFVYHNTAPSFYRGRGFRGLLRV